MLLCLGWKWRFHLPSTKSITVESSVLKVIEMILNLVPHGQMHCLDRINEILYDKDRNDDKRETQ
mgnify:CR=1 FL=1